MRIKPRFSLRLLLLLFTAIALLLGWKTNREHEREKAIAALCNAGTTVVVADSLPEWVKRVLGPRAGEYVLAVGSRGAWQRIGSRRIGEVARLGLPSDVGLSEPMSDIEAFFLLGCAQGDASFVRLTEADVAGLAQFDRCRYAYLSDATLTDAALANLGRLRRLEYLMLSDTAISDAGLAQLHNLKSLQYISLDGTHVTSVGVAALESAIPGVRVRW